MITAPFEYAANFLTGAAKVKHSLWSLYENELQEICSRLISGWKFQEDEVLCKSELLMHSNLHHIEIFPVTPSPHKHQVSNTLKPNRQCTILLDNQPMDSWGYQQNYGSGWNQSKNAKTAHKSAFRVLASLFKYDALKKCFLRIDPLQLFVQSSKKWSWWCWKLLSCQSLIYHFQRIK